MTIKNIIMSTRKNSLAEELKLKFLSVVGSRSDLFSGQLPFVANSQPETMSSSLESGSFGFGSKDSACELSEDTMGNSSSSVSIVSSSDLVMNADDEYDQEIESFMRTFVNLLFADPTAITLLQKAAFGQYSRTDCGRSWFARLINSQRTRTQCVSESTFYSLVQYFALVLFECGDADHFAPAKTLMNMCFTFYHEVEVPGCEPFKEYLSTYLMDQPIWRSLRFWNAAFFDALQCERVLRPVATYNNIKGATLQEAIADEKQYQQNITFGQLGTFTCNMHAFGLNKELCIEFLRKQCSIASLSQEHVKMLHDNVNRMYAETDPWR